MTATPYVFNQNTAASHAVVAAAAGTRLKVLALTLTAAGNVTVTIEDSAGTDLIGPVSMTNGVPWVLPHNENGWARPTAGLGLSVVLSAGVQVGGVVVVGAEPGV